MGHDEDMAHTASVTPIFRNMTPDQAVEMAGRFGVNVEASFLAGRRTYTTDPNRTDAVQVAMFDAASVNEPALFDGLFA